MFKNIFKKLKKKKKKKKSEKKEEKVEKEEEEESFDAPPPPPDVSNFEFSSVVEDKENSTVGFQTGSLVSADNLLEMRNKLKKRKMNELEDKKKKIFGNENKQNLFLSELQNRLKKRKSKQRVVYQRRSNPKSISPSLPNRSHRKAPPIVTPEMRAKKKRHSFDNINISRIMKNVKNEYPNVVKKNEIERNVERKRGQFHKTKSHDEVNMVKIIDGMREPVMQSRRIKKQPPIPVKEKRVSPPQIVPRRNKTQPKAPDVKKEAIKVRRRRRGTPRDDPRMKKIEKDKDEEDNVKRISSPLLVKDENKNKSIDKMINDVVDEKKNEISMKISSDNDKKIKMDVKITKIDDDDDESEGESEGESDDELFEISNKNKKVNKLEIVKKKSIDMELNNDVGVRVKKPILIEMDVIKPVDVKMREEEMKKIEERNIVSEEERKEKEKERIRIVEEEEKVKREMERIKRIEEDEKEKERLRRSEEEEMKKKEMERIKMIEMEKEKERVRKMEEENMERQRIMLKRIEEEKKKEAERERKRKLFEEEKEKQRKIEEEKRKIEMEKERKRKMKEEKERERKRKKEKEKKLQEIELKKKRESETRKENELEKRMKKITLMKKKNVPSANTGKANNEPKKNVPGKFSSKKMEEFNKSIKIIKPKNVGVKKKDEQKTKVEKKVEVKKKKKKVEIKKKKVEVKKKKVEAKKKKVEVKKKKNSVEPKKKKNVEMSVKKKKLKIIHQSDRVIQKKEEIVIAKKKKKVEKKKGVRKISQNENEELLRLFFEYTSPSNAILEGMQRDEEGIMIPKGKGNDLYDFNVEKYVPNAPWCKGKEGYPKMCDVFSKEMGKEEYAKEFWKKLNDPLGVNFSNVEDIVMKGNGGRKIMKLKEVFDNYWMIERRIGRLFDEDYKYNESLSVKSYEVCKEIIRTEQIYVRKLKIFIHSYVFSLKLIPEYGKFVKILENAFNLLVNGQKKVLKELERSENTKETILIFTFFMKELNHFIKFLHFYRNILNILHNDKEMKEDFDFVLICRDISTDLMIKEETTKELEDFLHLSSERLHEYNNFLEELLRIEKMRKGKKNEKIFQSLENAKKNFEIFFQKYKRQKKSIDCKIELDKLIQKNDVLKKMIQKSSISNYSHNVIYNNQNASLYILDYMIILRFISPKVFEDTIEKESFVIIDMNKPKIRCGVLKNKAEFEIESWLDNTKTVIKCENKELSLTYVMDINNLLKLANNNMLRTMYYGTLKMETSSKLVRFKKRWIVVSCDYKFRILKKQGGNLKSEFSLIGSGYGIMDKKKFEFFIDQGKMGGTKYICRADNVKEFYNWISFFEYVGVKKEN